MRSRPAPTTRTQSRWSPPPTRSTRTTSPSSTNLAPSSRGPPIGKNAVRIIDEAGRELGERHEGMLEFRGPSVTKGYFRNEPKTRELFHDGWIKSGDRAYIANGDIHITGRVKDIIIRAGRNTYPHEIEESI